MALGSILLAFAALACAVLGFLTTPIPGLGAVFSFAAPALALGGSIMGGVAMSRAKRAGASTDVARTGVILSTIALVPALLTAMFCGVCNALCATGEIHVQRSVSYGVGNQATPDDSAGARALPPPAFAGAPAPPPMAAPTATTPGAATAPAAPGPGARPGGAQPSAPAPGAVAAPPALPPPPLPSGPQAQPGGK